MSGPVFVTIDWSKNGTFVDAGDDVSTRVRGAVTASYGRDQVTALSPVIAGRAQCMLDNQSKDYSPRNASSPLFGKLKPSRPVKVTRAVTVGTTTTTYTLFRGHTDDSPIDPDVEAKTVTVNMVDFLADLRGITISTPLYQGIPTGTAVGKVLDAIGWTGGRDLDTGATTIPWWWEEGTDAFDALQKILASEGLPALATIDSTGGFVFRDRHHRLRLTASKTSQATFRGTDRAAEPVMAPGFTYSDNWQNIVNSVTLAIDERRVQNVAPVFSTDDVIILGASASTTILVQSSDPFQSAVTPVSGTDYTVTAGTITAVSISRTSGASTSITLTAGGGGATVTGLQLRAQPVSVVRTYQVTATDSTSITDYGQRALPSGAEPVWAGLLDAQSLASLIVLQRKQPLPILTVRFSCQHTQAVRLTKVLALNLSDRVTVIETETALNQDFFVETIQHTVNSMVDHEVVFGLEAVPSSPTSAFILGTSVLNGSDPLGF